MHDRQCLRSCSDDGSPLGVSNWNNMTMRFDAWALLCEFYWFLVKVTKAFVVVGRCKFLLAMALQRCKVCSFIVALIFMLVPFRHRRWSSHRGIWATTSTSSRCVKKSWTQRSEYIFWGTTKEIHRNPSLIQSLSGHSCMLTSLLPLVVARNWSPCFQDGKFAVQTEGVTKVWWNICGWCLHIRDLQNLLGMDDASRKPIVFWGLGIYFSWHVSIDCGPVI